MALNQRKRNAIRRVGAATKRFNEFERSIPGEIERRVVGARQNFAKGEISKYLFSGASCFGPQYGMVTRRVRRI
jgi:hypothetical protein